MALFDETRRARSSLRLVIVVVVALLVVVYWVGIGISFSRDEDSRSLPYESTPFATLRNRSANDATALSARTYSILEPVSIVGVSKELSPPPTGLTPREAGFPKALHSFVQVGADKRLVLDDAPFFITGLNNYYMYSRAAHIGEGRRQVDDVFASAEKLGMNVLRFWAFADGDTWNALQPEPGIIDEAMFREGLDYIVTKARECGIRLIVTLTNGKSHYGGMEQYVKWVNLTSITDFYTSPVTRRLFQDYVYTLLYRRNTIDGVLYKDNPTILGWDLANEPIDPGHPGSQALQDWVMKMSGFIKKHDPDHLVMVGWEGFFGDSTPERIIHNPYVHKSTSLSGTPYRHDDVCAGADFYQNHLPETIDLCVAHLYPDTWTACDDACELDFAKRWIRQHLEVAAELGRPFLLGEFGKQKPITERNAFYRLVHRELINAAQLGYPVAGSLMWMLSDSTYPDYDGFTVYDEIRGVMQTRPVPQISMGITPEHAKMWNLEELMACYMERAENQFTSEGVYWDSGWEETLEIMANYSRDMGSIAQEPQQHPKAWI